MKKFKLFIENFLVYGLGGIISKIIPLIMLPIVTRLMPNTDYYGISDLSNTVVSFGSALAIMGMYDAMYRMFFEKNDEQFKKKVCSTALIFTIFTSLIVFAVMLLSRDLIATHFFSDRKYTYVVCLSAMATLVGATNSIVSAPTRMQNKRKVFLVTNTVSPLISYSISIPMLLAGHYVIALPLASVISGVTMEVIFGVMNRKWFNPEDFDKKLLKKLLVIAIPLLPNFIIYWIFNSCDRLMIAKMLGNSCAGVYAIGSKLGQISQLIYTAFAGGWQYFAFSTMKEEKQVESNSMVFEYLSVISLLSGIFMCAWSLPIFQILFVGDYVSGYTVAPYLFLAPLLQMLFQVACNQFIVVKKTWPNMLILFTGAVLNILMNLFLIPKMGIEGAAIATLLGYAVSDFICVIVLCKMHLMIVSARLLYIIVLGIIYVVGWRMYFTDNPLISTMLAGVVAIIYFVFYKNDIASLFRRGQNNEIEKA